MIRRNASTPDSNGVAQRRQGRIGLIDDRDVIRGGDRHRAVVGRRAPDRQPYAVADADALADAMERDPHRSPSGRSTASLDALRRRASCLRERRSAAPPVHGVSRGRSGI